MKKIPYDINSKAAKISAFLADKIGKYELFTGEEILPYGQSTIREQANFTYSPLGKAFEKEIKTIEDEGIKQVEALKALKSEENKEDIKSVEEIFPKVMRPNKIKNEIYEIGKWEEKIKCKDLKHEAKKYTYDFQQYETIRSFAESLYTCKASIAEAKEGQSNLLENLVEFNNKFRTKKRG